MLTDQRQDLQNQLAAILAEAKKQGFSHVDLLPLEVQDHYQARISALETEVEEIGEQIRCLVDQLQQAKQAVEPIDIPENAEQLQVQLDLAKKSSDFYEKLMHEAEDRATKYQRKWEEALRKQISAEDAAKQINRLEVENRNLQQSKIMMLDEIRRMKSIYDTLRERDLAALVDKEEKLMTSEKQLAEFDIKFEKLLQDNLAYEKQSDEVISTLDAVVTETTHEARVSRQQQSLTFSEIQPLRRFYSYANDILAIYQGIFKQLLNTTEPNVTFSCDFREMVNSRLRAASEEFQAFHTVRALFAEEDTPGTEHSKQLDDLAKSAQQMSSTLELIGVDVSKYLWDLQRRPNIRNLIRMKFGVVR